MTFVFALMAVLAFVAFGYHASRRNGHGMVYAATMLAVWIALFLWWTGALGAAEDATAARPSSAALSGGQPPAGGGTAART